MKNKFKKLPRKAFESEPKSCIFERLGGCDSFHYNGSDSTLGKNWLKVQFPKNNRVLKESEIELLEKCKFRSKLLSKSSDQAKDRVRTLISLIENNPKDRNGYVHLPSTFLGKLFKSQQMVSNIFECLVNGGILEVDKYYNKDLGISRGYRLSLKFKSCEVLHSLRKRLNIVKMKKKEFRENIIEFNPRNDGESLIDHELNGIDKDHQDIIKKSLSPFVRNRFIEHGFDPTETKNCSCCKQEYPNIMFSISSETNKINNKCKICWHEEVKDNKDIQEQLKMTRAIVENLPFNKNKRRYKI